MVVGSAQKRGRPRKSDRPVLTAAQSQALIIDAATTAQPLPAAQVARRLGVTRAAVSKWRKDPVFRKRLEIEITNRFANEVNARLNARDKRLEPRREALRRLNRNHAAYVSAWVSRHWTGPTVSPFDGETYATREALVDHYIKNNVLPAADVEAALERADREEAAQCAEEERQRKLKNVNGN